tara:strand:+ start:3745 stop:4416 length:672 start_codon:yes stop_codon:yes gene_type:complete
MSTNPEYTLSILPPINVPNTRLIGEGSYSKKMQNILRRLKMKADGVVPPEHTPIRVTLIEFLEGMKELIQPDGDVPLNEGNFGMPTEYNNRMEFLLGDILDRLRWTGPMGWGNLVTGSPGDFGDELKNAEIQLRPDIDIQGAYFITLEVTPRIVLDAYNPVLFLVQLRNFILEVLELNEMPIIDPTELGGKRKVVKRKRKSLKKKRKTKRKIKRKKTLKKRKK